MQHGQRSSTLVGLFLSSFLVVAGACGNSNNQDGGGRGSGGTTSGSGGRASTTATGGSTSVNGTGGGTSTTGTGGNTSTTGAGGSTSTTGAGGTPAADASANDGAGTGVAGNLLTNGGFTSGVIPPWVVEITAPAAATSEVVPEGPTGNNALKIAVTAVDGPTWHVQAFNPVALESGKQYTLTFWAKAKTAFTIPVICMQNHPPNLHHLYPDFNAAITTEWKQFTSTFTLAESDPLLRINFGNLASAVGQVVWISNVVLTTQ